MTGQEPVRVPPESGTDRLLPAFFDDLFLPISTTRRT